MTPAQFPIGGDTSPLPCRARFASFGAANSPAVSTHRRGSLIPARAGFVAGALSGIGGVSPVLLSPTNSTGASASVAFSFGAVAESVGQTPAAIQPKYETSPLVQASGGFGSLQTATARTALPANAVASQGAA